MKFHKILLMPKAQPLCTIAELKLRDSVLVEVEKKIALLLCHAKRDTKIVCPNLGGFGEKFYSKRFNSGVAEIRVCAGLPRWQCEESAWQWRRHKRNRIDSWVRKIP